MLLGKTNLTEFANILAIGMPSGYSSLGGQVLNPYATEMDARGTPFVLPGGSSSGSAVAVAAGLAAAAIGTETSGSLLSPASMNGVVTVKPTVGLVSRAGIIPIAHSQDTAGPMTRTVRDAALLLGVLAGPDPLDPATLARRRRCRTISPRWTRDGLRGARIGVPSDPADPGNDVFYGTLPPHGARGDGAGHPRAAGLRRQRGARQHRRRGLDARARLGVPDPQPQPRKRATAPGGARPQRVRA